MTQIKLELQVKLELDVASDTKAIIHRSIKDYHEQVYASKLHNLEEMVNF